MRTNFYKFTYKIVYFKKKTLNNFKKNNNW